MTCLSQNSRTVILQPAGNVSVCYNDSLVLTCTTTEGALEWDTGSMSRLFNKRQDSVMLGNLNLTVVSFLKDGNSLSVTSTATLDRFTLTSGGLAVKCREANTRITKEVFVTAAGE